MAAEREGYVEGRNAPERRVRGKIRPTCTEAAAQVAFRLADRRVDRSAMLLRVPVGSCSIRGRLASRFGSVRTMPPQRRRAFGRRKLPAASPALLGARRKEGGVPDTPESRSRERLLRGPSQAVLREVTDSRWRWSPRRRGRQ